VHLRKQIYVFIYILILECSLFKFFALTSITIELTYTELKIFQGGYQKYIGAGEMPKDSTSSTLVNASEQYKLEETGIKEAEGNYDSNCKLK
jgi:hypothetical protein